MDKARSCKASVADFSAEVRSPVLSICQVTDRGVVFTSAHAFDIGVSIEMGFHVRFQEPEEDASRSVFLACEGQVVGCMLCAGMDGLPVFEVTLLFTGFKRGDSQTLARFTESELANSLLRLEAVGLN